MTQVLSHMEAVDAIVRALEPRAAFAFGCMCVGRAWPLLENWGQKNAPEVLVDIRQGIDSIWNWLDGSGLQPSGIVDRCDQVSPGDEPDDDSQTAQRVLNAVSTLAASVEEGVPEWCASIAQANLDLLDDYLYRVLHLSAFDPEDRTENDRVVANNELMTAEMFRQMRDLEILQHVHEGELIRRNLTERLLG